ncbi:MAG TPA: hypothetical protein VHX86_10770 [Tepidisphaeraceae bacterium]|jgi:hypothetical protein|nr:hypothetical protein [Tepidisphaeraceae bacterium]
MNRAERNKIVGPVKASHVAYLAGNSVATSPHAEGLRQRFANFASKFQAFTRKSEGSQNALKQIANLARLLFGLQEDIRRFHLPAYSFDSEKRMINRSIIAGLDARLTSRYDGFGAPRGPTSHGEALLHCYLDLFITFTVMQMPKEIGAKPFYLINPRTGNTGELELDVIFEDFRLAFEFQGHPGHYNDPNTRAKDAFKLAELPAQSRVLIPVNASQLNSGILESLVANSIKDHVGVHEVVANGDSPRFTAATASPQQLLQFSKVVQRLYLADAIFREALAWVDGKASTYLAAPINDGTVSATTAAPRRITGNPDLDLATIYANLRYVTEVRRA